MSKLYYDKAIHAAYMAEEFGVRFYNGHITPKYRTIYSLLDMLRKAERKELNFADGFDKLYIHPDSLSIFEPQEEDLVEGDDGDYYCEGYFRASKYYIDELKEKSNQVKFDAIIQRNGKPFIMPKDESCQ